MQVGDFEGSLGRFLGKDLGVFAILSIFALFSLLTFQGNPVLNKEKKKRREGKIRRTRPFTVKKLAICFTFSDLGFEVLNFKQSLQSKLEF